MSRRVLDILRAQLNANAYTLAGENNYTWMYTQRPTFMYTKTTNVQQQNIHIDIYSTIGAIPCDISILKTINICCVFSWDPSQKNQQHVLELQVLKHIIDLIISSRNLEIIECI